MLSYPLIFLMFKFSINKDGFLWRLTHKEGKIKRTIRMYMLKDMKTIKIFPIIKIDKLSKFISKKGLLLFGSLLFLLILTFTPFFYFLDKFLINTKVGQVNVSGLTKEKAQNGSQRLLL